MSSAKCSAFLTYLANQQTCSDKINAQPICNLPNIMNINNVLINGELNPFTNPLKIANLKNWISVQSQKLNSIYKGIDSNLTWQEATYCKITNPENTSQYYYPLNPYSPHTNIYNLGYKPLSLIGKEFQNTIIGVNCPYKLPPYLEYFISTDLFVIVFIILIVLIILYALLFSNSDTDNKKSIN